MSEYFSWARAFRIFPKILNGLGITLMTVVLALVIATVIGLLLALIRVRKVPVLNQIAVVAISFVRGTPLIVMLFIVYYGLPLLVGNLFGVDLSGVDAVVFGIIAFGINQAAFMAELFRGGIEAIPAGQTEAARAVGLTGWQTFRRVLLPQAVRLVIPGYGVMSVNMFQSTALVAALGVMDVMGKASAMGVATNHYLEPYFDAGVIFVVFGVAMDFGFRVLSKRFSRGVAKTS